MSAPAIGSLAHERLRRVGAYLRSAPGTIAYFWAVLVTTVSVRSLGPGTMQELIETQSTNVHNLLHHPVRVLFASAFWLDSTHISLTLIVLFFLVMAPVEHKIGTWRWLVVGAAAHVIATLLTESFVGYAVRHGFMAHRLVRTADVGISYFTASVTAVAAILLPRRVRGVVVSALIAYLIWRVSIGQTFTDWGHLLSFGIGLLLAPWATANAAPFNLRWWKSTMTPVSS